MVQSSAVSIFLRTSPLKLIATDPIVINNIDNNLFSTVNKLLSKSMKTYAKKIFNIKSVVFESKN